MDFYPLLLAEQEERADSGVEWYAVDPNVMYPLTIDFIRAELNSAVQPPESIRQHMLAASQCAAEDWELAKQSIVHCPAGKRQNRALCLELARLIYTALLHDAVGKPVGVHILKDDRWKL